MSKTAGSGASAAETWGEEGTPGKKTLRRTVSLGGLDGPRELWVRRLAAESALIRCSARHRFLSYDFLSGPKAALEVSDGVETRSVKSCYLEL